MILIWKAAFWNSKVFQSESNTAHKYLSKYSFLNLSFFPNVLTSKKHTSNLVFTFLTRAAVDDLLYLLIHIFTGCTYKQPVSSFLMGNHRTCNRITTNTNSVTWSFTSHGENAFFTRTLRLFSFHVIMLGATFTLFRSRQLEMWRPGGCDLCLHPQMWWGGSKCFTASSGVGRKQRPSPQRYIMSDTHWPRGTCSRVRAIIYVPGEIRQTFPDLLCCYGSKHHWEVLVSSVPSAAV